MLNVENFVVKCSGASNFSGIENIGKKLDIIITKLDDGVMEATLSNTVYCHQTSHIFLFQNIAIDANNQLMELFVVTDAARKTGCSNIVAIIPYIAYSRQDRMFHTMSSISMKLCASLMEAAGISKLITVDIHSTSSIAFFDIPSINVTTIELFADSIKQNFQQTQPLIFAPDYGSFDRVRLIANIIKTDFGIIHKMRYPDHSIIMETIKDPTNRDCVLIDDVVYTGKTMKQAAMLLKSKGAKSVTAYVSHLVNPSIIDDVLTTLDQLYITNSIPNKLDSRVSVLDIFPQILKVIQL